MQRICRSTDLSDAEFYKFIRTEIRPIRNDHDSAWYKIFFVYSCNVVSWNDERNSFANEFTSAKAAATIKENYVYEIHENILSEIKTSQSWGRTSYSLRSIAPTGPRIYYDVNSTSDRHPDSTQILVFETRFNDRVGPNGRTQRIMCRNGYLYVYQEEVNCIRASSGESLRDYTIRRDGKTYLRRLGNIGSSCTVFNP